MPLFISTTAGVPNPLLEQNFVQPVPCNSTVDEFNRNLTKFMSIVKEHQKSSYLRRKIIKYTQTALDPENVYWELCQRMGICGQRDEPLSEEDDYESQEERAPTTDAGEDQSNLDTVDEHGGTQTGSTFWNRNPHSTRR